MREGNVSKLIFENFTLIYGEDELCSFFEDLDFYKNSGSLKQIIFLGQIRSLDQMKEIRRKRRELGLPA